MTVARLGEPHPRHRAVPRCSSSERVARERVARERVACKRVACEHIAREGVTRERVACERVACERVVREGVARERVGGRERIGGGGVFVGARALCAFERVGGGSPPRRFVRCSSLSISLIDDGRS